MPAPTGYTESQLATFIVQELGEVGQALGWTGSTAQVTDAVAETELLLGVDDVQDLLPDQVLDLRATARVVGWRAAVKGLAARYTFSEENGVKYDRSDLQKMAQVALSIAESEAPAGVSTAPPVSVGRFRSVDPYTPSGGDLGTF